MKENNYRSRNMNEVLAPLLSRIFLGSIRNLFPISIRRDARPDNKQRQRKQDGPNPGNENQRLDRGVDDFPIVDVRKGFFLRRFVLPQKLAQRRPPLPHVELQQPLLRHGLSDEIYPRVVTRFQGRQVLVELGAAAGRDVQHDFSVVGCQSAHRFDPAEGPLLAQKGCRGDRQPAPGPLFFVPDGQHDLHVGSRRDPLHEPVRGQESRVETAPSESGRDRAVGRSVFRHGVEEIGDLHGLVVVDRRVSQLFQSGVKRGGAGPPQSDHGQLEPFGRALGLRSEQHVGQNGGASPNSGHFFG
mmetsp:Transcript_34666/g.80165  ORF Transcript_34666/g.80165 Transcript_34666/m.80165 type:complete len:300 (+) Transcript_34666:274-1173(+)